MSKAILAAYPNFELVSIDAAIFAKHGLYGIDYRVDHYQEYQQEAHRDCEERLVRLLRDKNKNIMLDRSFWNKRDRDEVKQIIESHGAKWVLIYLKASKKVLWERIQRRKAGPNTAESAFDVTEGILDQYIEGFEAPDGEGDIVLEVL